MLAAASYVPHLSIPQRPNVSQEDSSSIFVFTSGGRMDVSPLRWGSSRRRRSQSRQSNSYPHRNESTSSRPLPYTDPVPQIEWCGSPTSLPPGPWPNHEQPSSHYLDVPSAQHLSVLPPGHIIDPRSVQAAEQSRRRRRGQRAHDSPFWNDEEEHQSIDPVDISLLYPQMSPYGDRQSTYSAPDELEHYQARFLNQYDTPGFIDLASPDTPPALGIPRSPTYPPATTRRIYRSTNTTDTAFEAEEDFHLFAQATAGLSHDQEFFPPQPSPRTNLSLHTAIPTLRPEPEGSVSPFAETPTTRHALAQLAQMPEGSHQHSPDDHRPSPVTAHSLRPPLLRATTVIPQISPVEDFEVLGDDDLPDYAESQAQAQAHQRMEATRRAQELQMRWQLSGARRGV